MKFIYKFMEVYIFLLLAILCLLGAAQNLMYGHTFTTIGLTVVMVVFLYIFKKEKSKG